MPASNLVALNKSRKPDATDFDIVIYASGVCTCEDFLGDIYGEVLVDPSSTYFKSRGFHPPM
jgi:hypothetical protein